MGLDVFYSESNGQTMNASWLLKEGVTHWSHRQAMFKTCFWMIDTGIRLDPKRKHMASLNQDNLRDIYLQKD